MAPHLPHPRDPAPQARPTPWLRVAGAASALLAAVSLAGCARPEPPPEPVRSVKVMTLTPGVFATTQEYAAEVRARTETRLAFRVAGKLLQRQAELGQRVRRGQLLAQLDPQDLQLASEAARAQVVAATTQRNLAAADFKRFASLREQNFISSAELERREASLKSAQAQLEQAQAQYAMQGNQAGYAALRATAAGVVTGIEAEPGQVVAAGTPVVRLALDGERDAVFAVPEDRLSAMRAGAEVAIRQWNSQAMLAGRVREVSASADPVTRTYQVKVGIAGEAPPLGSTVYVTPLGAGPVGAPVIKVPTSALLQHGEGSAVWVLDKDTMTVRLQEVREVVVDGNDAVVATGLSPGMLVVTAGVHVLAPGQKVSIWQEQP